MILCRYAENEDVFDILALDKENFSNNFDEKFYLEYIKNQRVIVAENEKKVIGYILFNQILDEAEIYKIVVLKDFRKKQIAFKIFEFLLNELKKNNVKKIFLEVRKSNIPAINLYIKCGFIEIREIVDYYSNPKENGIMMLKEVV
ncbi:MULTISPECIES: ribosomal protein S18-alanine N-acetyltransferase [unclassified Parvimonas]|uniref:ribosomal protein S18-alanine N-acetyltransferase n=1 Tax=unclassified Parvimonas TaxID=1151464 RepID=UPI002B497D11|nr:MULTISPECIES: ribosomal protein S18-alanine N-acetyltransferase [unclassified Parvimonas]MEB3025682.1 ribosomal protein S18-alanine N-acetyltransferase [Parvimonas sp. M13]MEB3089799.1 ribosomal protein S18-alanine N-acetyltransferase [Parvimonas sp. M20]